MYKKNDVMISTEDFLKELTILFEKHYKYRLSQNIKRGLRYKKLKNKEKTM